MAKPLRLGDFIIEHMESILVQWEIFAKTIKPQGIKMDRDDLRDHAAFMLQTIALSLTTKQTNRERAEKSLNLAPIDPNATPAEAHAADRLLFGFTIDQLFSEYRALRFSVLHLWDKSSKEDLITDDADIILFHQSIDQSIAESLSKYSALLKYSQDMFLAILGHDLRNPLATTITSASMLMSYEDISDKVRSNAARIYTTSQRMNLLITDLMDFTKSQLGIKFSVKLAPANIANICKDIIDEQKIVHSERKIVEKVKGSFDGNWDEQRIGQLFSNLLGNAIQHGDSKSPIEINLSSSQDAVKIIITNQGKPIPILKLPHIFEPLVRHAENENADYSQKTSLGLGLYIVKQIVLAHNGTLNVSSTEKKGTTFEITLPFN